MASGQGLAKTRPWKGTGIPPPSLSPSQLFWSLPLMDRPLGLSTLQVSTSKTLFPDSNCWGGHLHLSIQNPSSEFSLSFIPFFLSQGLAM